MGQTIADQLIEEGEVKGELRATRRHLRQLLSSQFGALPESLAQQIESIMNLERLEKALIQAPHLKSLLELQL